MLLKHWPPLNRLIGRVVNMNSRLMEKKRNCFKFRDIIFDTGHYSSKNIFCTKEGLKHEFKKNPKLFGWWKYISLKTSKSIFVFLFLIFSSLLPLASFSDLWRLSVTSGDFEWPLAVELGTKNYKIMYFF
jgi:hypothetical protein